MAAKDTPMSAALTSVGPPQDVRYERAHRVVVAPSGSSVYVSPLHRGGGGKRGKIVGYSRSASRRHTRWLQSIDGDALEGSSFACTLTVRDIPAGPLEWHRALNAMITALSRLGVVRGHWVMENQKRGCPHLHMGIWLLDDSLSLAMVRAMVVGAWLRIAAEWRPRASGQDVKELEHGGWSKYVAKHSSRSVTHSQRTGMPPGWETSGRLWGHFGDWMAYRSELSYVVDSKTWVQLRRLLRGWRRGDAARALMVARKAAEAAQTLKARELAVHHLRLARRRVEAAQGRMGRGMQQVEAMREWVPRDVMMRMLEAAIELTRADDGSGGGWCIIGPDLVQDAL